MTRDSLTITDNRNGKTYEVPITDDTIRALDLRQIKVNQSDFGMMSYDPAFNNTALCKSKVTFIDGVSVNYIPSDQDASPAAPPERQTGTDAAAGRIRSATE